MEGSTYNVKVTGEGLTLEREVPKEIGEKIVVLVLSNGAARFATSSPVQASPAGTVLAMQGSSTDESEMSVREFLNTHKAQRIPDKITAIGYFLKNTRGHSAFSRADIVREFEAAAEAIPKNLNRDMKWTLKAAWIAPKQGSKDTYYVTNEGSQAVEKHFPSDLVKRTRQLTGGKRSRKVKGNNGGEEEV
jgi:hypothetical protein